MMLVVVGLTYARKMAAMAAMAAATNEPPMVLAAPVKGAMGEPVGPAGKALDCRLSVNFFETAVVD